MIYTIYLDNAATTPILPNVLNAMMPYLKDDYGNAGAIYSHGRKSAEAISMARKQVADLVGCSPEHIIFTSGGSEANNLAIRGIASHLIKTGKTHILTSAVEHDSVLNSVRLMCNESLGGQFTSTMVGVDSSGVVSTNRLSEAITDTTGLVSVMYVNNETGAVMPIKEISDACHKRGVLFHTDCVQALGFQEIDVNDIGCDFMSISAHKINAPKGVGALYVRDASLLSPIIVGGSEQEYGIRGGTENVAGIVGFGMACEIISEETVKARSRRIRFLTGVFSESLNQGLRELKISNLTKYNSRFDSKMRNIRFKGIDGQTLVLLLDSRGVCVSAGSACRSHEIRCNSKFAVGKR